MISVRAHRAYWASTSIAKTTVKQDCTTCGKEFDVKRTNEANWRKVECCSPECLAVAIKKQSFPGGRGNRASTQHTLNSRCSQCDSITPISYNALGMIKTLTCSNCGHKSGVINES